MDQSSAPEMSVLRMATEGILGVMVQQVMVLSYQALLLSNSYSSISPICVPLGGTVRMQEEQFPSDAHAPCLSNTPRAAKCSRGGEQKAFEHPPARCWHQCGPGAPTPIFPPQTPKRCGKIWEESPSACSVSPACPKQWEASRNLLEEGSRRGEAQL